MSNTTELRAAMRSGSARGSDIRLETNQQNELLTANGLPFYTEMVRRGVSWATMATSAVAGLVVRPSTAAAVELFNNYGSGGKSLVIDRLFSHNLVSTNVIESFTLWAQVTASKAAPSEASLAIRGSSGKPYSGAVVTAVATTVIASGWFPWGQGFTKGAGGVVPHGVITADVEGRLIVPPQSSLCIHVVSSLVGQTFCSGASWFEEQLEIN